jgi:hypothetical protein
MPNDLINIEHPLASQQQSFTISVTTGAFSTLRLLPSIIKNALVDPAEIYWIEQQKMEFGGDAWFEAFVAVNHPLQTHSGDHADLALSDRPASVVAPPDAFPQLWTIVLAVLWKKLVIC